MSIKNHTIAAGTNGKLVIDGFQGFDVDSCFCILAFGHRYHEYGIADNSMLYCYKTNIAGDGDLVLAMDGETPTLYQYREDKRITYDGNKRILHDPARIYARVLCAFNFYS